MSDNTRRVCSYWTYVSGTAGYQLRCVAKKSEFTGYDWKESDISCFNADPNDTDYGQCDGSGGVDSCWSCSKYSPGGIGFGIFDPNAPTIFRLPYICDVYNLRAQISKCCYWDNDEGSSFTIDAKTGQITPPDNLCSKGEEAAEWNDPTQPPSPPATSGTLYYLPCNGVKAECPFYTGVQWQYCVDDKMQTGDQILVQQIYELRYYSDEWDNYTEPTKIYNSRFIDPTIFAWYGTYLVGSGTILNREVTTPEMSTYNYAVLDKVELDLSTGAVTKTKKLPAGSTSKTESGIPVFPTLIRNLKQLVPLLPKIYFPYNGYIHRHWTDNGNKVDVIGNSLGAKKVFVVNSAITQLPSIIYKVQEKIATSGMVDATTQAQFNSTISGTVQILQTYYPEEVYMADPTVESGYFIIQDVKLKVNVSQDLYLFSLCYDGSWKLSSVNVKDYFYHAFLLQTTFLSNWWTDTYLNNAIIDGNITYSFPANNFGSSFKPQLTLNDLYWHNHDTVSVGILDQLEKYSYYIVKVTVEEKSLGYTDWKVMTTCGDTLVTIPDSNLNRVFGWELDYARFEGLDKDGNSVTIEMELSYPSSLTNLDESLPANVIILTPKEGESFKTLNKQTTLLIIKYYYFKEKKGPVSLESGETLYFPTGAGTQVESPPFDLSFSTYSFKVENLNERTPELRGVFKDDTGRIIGIKNQKLLIQYKKVLCRDYEIYYDWTANFQQFAKLPTHWIMYIDRIPFEDRYIGNTNKYLVPVCGDHEVAQFYHAGIGPMWYPYITCEDDVLYQVGTIANMCTAPVEGEHDANDHRLRGPDDKYPELIGDPHPSIWECMNDYDYGYSSKISNNIFIGRGDARGELNLDIYLTEGWAFPIFGNVLREQSWLNRCTDYLQYFDSRSYVASFSWKWFPILESWSDQEDLFSENTLSPFMFLKCMSVGGSDINEHEDSTRYRYKDVLLSKYSSSIQYPSDYIWYQFKEDSLTSAEAVQWLYREKWKDIERENATSSGSLKNVVSALSLDYPDYVYGYAGISHVRDEFQKTADEGEYFLIFSPPTFNPDGTLVSDAYFQISPGPPRYIDLKTMAWKDDEVLRAGQKVISLYKNWNTENDWEESPNLWSESITVGTKTEAQEKENYFKTYDSDTEIETEHYYFKGLDITLRPEYFPYKIGTDFLTGKEYGIKLKINSTTGHPNRNLFNLYTYYTYYRGRLSSPVGALDTYALDWMPSARAYSKELTFDMGKPISLNELKLTFTTGVVTELNSDGTTANYVAFFPGCGVLATNTRDEYGNETDWESYCSFSAISYDECKVYKKGISNSVSYKLEPTAQTLATKYRFFKFVFNDWIQDSGVLQLRGVQFREMDFEARIETIKVYERRYYKTLGTSYDFVYHGTEAYPMMTLADDYSTIYLNEGRIQGLMGIGSFKAVHKCRGREGLIKYNDKDIELHRGSGSDIAEVETLQESLYDLARGVLEGSTTYTINLHSSFETYANSLGVTFPSVGYLEMNSLVPQLKYTVGEIPNQGLMWSGKGHWYVNDKRNPPTQRRMCGGIPSPWAYRTWAWTTDYCFQHIGHGGACEEGTSPLIVYFQGVAGPTLIGGELPVGMRSE